MIGSTRKGGMLFCSGGLDLPAHLHPSPSMRGSVEEFELLTYEGKEGPPIFPSNSFTFASS